MLRYKGKLIAKEDFITKYAHFYTASEVWRIRELKPGRFMHGHNGVIVCEY